MTYAERLTYWLDRKSTEWRAWTVATVHRVIAKAVIKSMFADRWADGTDRVTAVPDVDADAVEIRPWGHHIAIGVNGRLVAELTPGRAVELATELAKAAAEVDRGQRR